LPPNSSKAKVMGVCSIEKLILTKSIIYIYIVVLYVYRESKRDT
jgi:hypothetical protein